MVNASKAVFVLCVVFFILLVSYQVSLLRESFNPQQMVVMDYLDGKGVFDEGSTIEEISHLEDVKRIMFFADVLFWFLLLAILIFGYPLFKQGELYSSLSAAGAVGLISISLIILLIMLDFSFLFTYFHKILFKDGTWTFPAESMLIQAFPMPFFIKMARSIFITSLVLDGIVLMIAVIMRARNYRKS